MTNYITKLKQIQTYLNGLITFIRPGLGFLSLVVLTSLLVPKLAFGQTFTDFSIFPEIRSLGDLLDFGLGFLVAIASPIAIIMIILGGFQAMTGGNEESVKKGRDKIVAAAVGLGIVLMAASIENLIQATFYGGQINVGYIVAALQELVIKNLTIMAVVIATIAIIWGGYKDFLSAFDAKTSGTEAARNAIFGLAVIFLAGGLANLITSAVDPTESNIIRQVESLVGSISGALESTIALMTVLGVIISILVITKGGFDYFLSSVTDKAKPLETIRKGVIGLALVLLSGFVALLMFDFFDQVDNVNVIFNLDNLPDQAQRVLIPVIQNVIDFFIIIASVAAVATIVYGGYIYFASSVSEQKVKGSQILANGVIGLVVVIIAGPLVQLIPQIIRTTYGTGTTSLELVLEPEPILNLVREVLGGFVIPIASLVTVFFFIWGGYLWLSARGDAEQVKKARSAMINALIGLIIVLTATTIVGLIVYFVRPSEYVEGGKSNKPFETQMIVYDLSHVKLKNLGK